jgi:lysophospholipase L1-like esterase
MLLAAACSSSHGAPVATSTTLSTDSKAALDTVTAVTALGDSVPYGTACDCTPYPPLSGADLERVVAHPVHVSNDAVPGATSRDVMRQVEEDGDVIGDVGQSQAIMIEIGANDVAHSSQCGNDASCYAPEIPHITKNIHAIVARVHAITTAHPVAVVLLDYWSVWLGGQYALDQGLDYVEAADDVTTMVNDAIRTVAAETKSIYVDLRTAFRGPNDEYDETYLLAPDGEHPNAAGHQRIADAVAAAVRH